MSISNRSPSTTCSASSCKKSNTCRVVNHPSFSHSAPIATVSVPGRILDDAGGHAWAQPQKRRRNIPMYRVCRVVRVNRVRMAQVFFYGCIDDWKGKMKRLRDLHRRWVMVGALQKSEKFV